MTDQDFGPLDRFVALYQDLKGDHWRTVEIESRPAAMKRVLAIAREYGQGKGWQQQIDNYLEAFRVALPAARLMPELNARTTLWTVSGPAFVRRMSGSYRLGDLRGASDGDWRTVTWVRLPEPLAIDLWLEAKQQSTTTGRLLAAIIPAALQGPINPPPPVLARPTVEAGQVALTVALDPADFDALQRLADRLGQAAETYLRSIVIQLIEAAEDD